MARLVLRDKCEEWVARDAQLRLAAGWRKGAGWHDPETGAVMAKYIESMSLEEAVTGLSFIRRAVLEYRNRDRRPA